MSTCEIPDNRPPDEAIGAVLRRCRTIAVVGLSPKPARDSHRVAAYLLEHGYDVIPVNPGQKEILGRPCFRTLSEIPFQVDLADLFVGPERVPSFVDQAVGQGIGVIWMQLGIVHEEAARKAREAGCTVIMNRCIMRDHMQLQTGGGR
ncbi:CoA-binding protein [Desulfatiglans anilini]|uniref:CoA-binding protein n=1 Tax=Desulfatiglans anilini TaxID=90728 RepID=UPI000418B44A|nr:CoA-binding protein [Desulfatiglans anilini]